ncbi:hypothetical protein Bbelb_383660 [Branchiostoma belcheri]|nr:hypothetical protein Bbelb_383660 [Branchiostoma belcheri]
MFQAQIAVDYLASGIREQAETMEENIPMAPRLPLTCKSAPSALPSQNPSVKLGGRKKVKLGRALADVDSDSPLFVDALGGQGRGGGLWHNFLGHVSPEADEELAFFPTRAQEKPDKHALQQCYRGSLEAKASPNYRRGRGQSVCVGNLASGEIAETRASGGSDSPLSQQGTAAIVGGPCVPTKRSNEEEPARFTK